MDETEKQETDKNLDEMWAVVCKVGSVPLLELTLNHASFAQTVENLFSASFLVRAPFNADCVEVDANGSGHIALVLTLPAAFDSCI